MKKSLKIISITLAVIGMPILAWATVLGVQQGGTAIQYPTTGFQTGSCLEGNGIGPIATTTCSGGTLTGGITNFLTYWTSATTVGATSSPTVAYITATSTTATSTFGYSVVSPCFSNSIAGPCLSGGSGTNYFTNSGVNTSLNTGSNLVMGSFNSTSTATSQFAGQVNIANNTALDLGGGSPCANDSQLKTGTDGTFLYTAPCGFYTELMSGQHPFSIFQNSFSGSATLSISSGGAVTSTATTSSTFPYASTTAITVSGTASTSSSSPTACRRAIPAAPARSLGTRARSDATASPAARSREEG